jgi:hypothetical protein
MNAQQNHQFQKQRCNNSVAVVFARFETYNTNHQTEKYRFNAGYDLGRINLTLLFGDMQKGGDGSCSPASSNDKVKADQ